MTERPNFIVIVADQLRADSLPFLNASTPVLTPCLDKLARHGVSFAEVFGQHSVCSPSRVSFLSGKYPHVAGHRTLHYLLQQDEPNFLRTFKDNGYHVVIAGNRGDALGPGANELSAHEYGNLPTANADEHWSVTGPAQWDKGNPLSRAYYRGERSQEDAQADADEATIRTAEHWLRNPPSSPWILFVPLFFPHPPFEVEQPWFSMYQREAIALPNSASGPQPRFLSELIREHGWDNLSEAQWREIKAVYFGMISRLDSHVGRLMDANTSKNTITAFFADHGEYLGDYGAIEKWPSGVNECLVRIPLLISGPGLASGTKSNALIELIDVFPTLLELAGIDRARQHTHFGRSFVACLADPAREHRHEVFTEGGFTTEEVKRLHTAPYPYDLKSTLPRRVPTSAGKVVAIRNREWTYVWRLYEGAELYNRIDDPQELNNLFGQVQYASIKSELRERLLRWLVETADVLPDQLGARRPDVELPRPGQWHP
ncbi:sulfatase-like hydrolase/transferase [Pseudomonas typographi]|uniref:sulfatase-like hydrolase/transferase n=1 Tax=Pseudomonas typographi TaxID=2715964 RepID=UPI001689E231|nr:sulfatase-like hydrolase/transferase [Pseudomonas typographi]MBD1587255.1 sulfatase-like hydrolase/transferase [Pseudomonas typographi]